MPRVVARPIAAVRWRATPLRSDLAALLLTLAVALLVLGCDRSPTDPGQGELAFQTLAKTTVAGHFVPQIREVVRDQARLDAIWSELWGSGAATPAVDFGRDMVVAASAAQVCFDVVAIEGITLEGDEFVVRLTEATPSLCSCARPESTFHLVRLRRLNGSERFAARSVPPACPS